LPGTRLGAFPTYRPRPGVISDRGFGAHARAVPEHRDATISAESVNTEIARLRHGLNGMLQALACRPSGERLQAPAHLRSHLDRLERQYGLPQGMLTAIAKVESDFDPRAVSYAGAQGMFQIMPATARDLGVADPFDPYQGAVGVAKHLARDFDRFGNWDQAVLAYNAGPGKVQRLLEGQIGFEDLKQEQKEYVPKVAAALSRARGLA
jgi:soluble lytic murein transglycosylase-like protein